MKLVDSFRINFRQRLERISSRFANFSNKIKRREKCNELWNGAIVYLVISRHFVLSNTWSFEESISSNYWSNNLWIHRVALVDGVNAQLLLHLSSSSFFFLETFAQSPSFFARHDFIWSQCSSLFFFNRRQWQFSHHCSNSQRRFTIDS